MWLFIHVEITLIHVIKMGPWFSYILQLLSDDPYLIGQRNDNIHTQGQVKMESWSHGDNTAIHFAYRKYNFRCMNFTPQTTKWAVYGDKYLSNVVIFTLHKLLQSYWLIYFRFVSWSQGNWSNTDSVYVFCFISWIIAYITSLTH